MIHKGFLFPIAVLIFTIMTGCEQPSSFFISRNYEKDDVLTANVGAPIVSLTFEERSASGDYLYHRDSEELLYAGKSGTTIKVSYREYSDGYARPAFNQELQYDLADTNRIKFKDHLIEVLNATNEKITYRVLEAADFKYVQGKIPADGHATAIGDGVGRIGVGVDEKGQIISIVDGGPASLTGLQRGDFIVSIDGRTTPTGNVNAIVSLLSGKIGSQVLIIVKRGSQQLVFYAMRDRISQ